MKLIKEYKITLLIMINVVLVLAMIRTGNLWFDITAINVGMWLVGRIANAEEEYRK